MFKAEVKQATQQRSDLNQTDHFLHALLATEPGQEPPKPPADILPPEPQSNGVIPPLPKMDPMSPFSQPPAPPPQQPLPEKPDVVRAMNPDPNHSISLKRIETEKPQSPMAASPNATTSPHKAESSIVQLLEALTTTRKELDLQGNRVRQLEELLKQERRARESAEERARHLLDRARMMSLEHNRQVEKIVEPPIHDLGSDGTASSSSEDDHDHSSSETDSIISTPATSNIVEMQKDTDNIDATTARLQERLVIMVREMDEMKAQMEGFKSRAETAEGERTSLAEMVERIRQNEEKKARSMEGGLRKKKSTEMATQTETASAAAETNSSAENGTGLHQPKAHDSTKAPTETNGAVVTPSRPTQEQLQSAIAAALSNRDDRLMQSAPYASILGVVLIGVGIMTYLNGWQKVER